MLAKERALHIGPPVAALAILEEAGASPLVTSLGPVPVGWFAIKNYFDRKNARREARETEVHANHKYDIIFPDTPY